MMTVVKRFFHFILLTDLTLVIVALIILTDALEYLSPSKLANLSFNNNHFFLVHFNTKSLPKNVDKLEEFLNEMARLPDAIAISETKLNSDTYSNISVPNNNFFS